MFKKKREVVFKQFGVDNSLAGMTTQVAGNFCINGSWERGFEKLDALLKITGFNKFGNIIMRAETHSNNIWFFEDLKNNESTQVVCDGVIYRGQGTAVFFPGGCPAIAFRDRKANLSGLLHGGWKSIAQGIVDNFLREWENAGGHKKNTQIIFLPATCREGAVYGREGYDYFLKTIYPTIATMRPNDYSRFINIVKGYKGHRDYATFDLLRLNCFLLMEKGYKKMKEIGGCVCCNNKFWFYDRDDKNKNGVKYRNAAFIVSGHRK
jgi:copper oxidase (laccase) domain-containing protein